MAEDSTDAERRARRAAQQRERRKRNPEKAREQARLYRERYPDRVRESKRRSYQKNREKNREYTRQWRVANPEKVAAARRRRAPRRPTMIYFHGRGWQDAYAALWEAQGGRCYLCGEKLEDVVRPSGRGRDTVIDHDYRCCPKHRSCPICRRGLACNRCNTGIGWFKDDPVLMRRVADALEAAQRLVTERLPGKLAQGELF